MQRQTELSNVLTWMCESRKFPVDNTNGRCILPNQDGTRPQVAEIEHFLRELLDVAKFSVDDLIDMVCIWNIVFVENVEHRLNYLSIDDMVNIIIFELCREIFSILRCGGEMKIGQKRA